MIEFQVREEVADNTWEDKKWEEKLQIFFTYWVSTFELVIR